MLELNEVVGYFDRNPEICFETWTTFAVLLLPSYPACIQNIPVSGDFFNSLYAYSIAIWDFLYHVRYTRGYRAEYGVAIFTQSFQSNSPEGPGFGKYLIVFHNNLCWVYLLPLSYDLASSGTVRGCYPPECYPRQHPPSIFLHPTTSHLQKGKGRSRISWSTSLTPRIWLSESMSDKLRRSRSPVRIGRLSLPLNSRNRPVQIFLSHFATKARRQRLGPNHHQRTEAG